MLKDFEYYHGAVFSKLIHESPNPVEFGLFPTESNASYVINGRVGIYIKHSGKRLSPWRFSFQKVHQKELTQMKENLDKVYLILVCGDDGVVALSFEEVKQILDDNHDDVEWISAARSPRKEYTIKGSNGQLTKKVSNIEFPRKVLEGLTITI